MNKIVNLLTMRLCQRFVFPVMPSFFIALKIIVNFLKLSCRKYWMINYVRYLGQISFPQFWLYSSWYMHAYMYSLQRLKSFVRLALGKLSCPVYGQCSVHNKQPWFFARLEWLVKHGALVFKAIYTLNITYFGSYIWTTRTCFRFFPQFVQPQCISREMLFFEVR